MKQVQKVAIVGTGVIGASWATFFLYKGYAVSAYDPAENAEENLKARVTVFLQDLFELDRVDAIDEQVQRLLTQLTFEKDIAKAVHDADFIQESGPERLELKQELYRQITESCPGDTIIASSSSGLKVSDIQEDAIHPERVLLGHPFNPPHLLPLVEIIGGKKTERSFIDDAYQFYASLGKKPILIHKEVKGHVANRLQSALWREAFYLVSEGVCSAEDVDIAIANGPGIRWAVFGPYLNMQLANQQGFKAAMHHLGGPMMEWWGDMHSYSLNDEEIEHLGQETQNFIDKLGDGYDLQGKRDEALIEILNLRKKLDLP
ncbi:3-hydroxyacyl-CoA dehydrogenase NAD-binding domain-containing protein [Acinetobacter sp. WZC-1]|uniref:3-hydroxyacyl-CoA dehydrogenase NAD-binding domain-containing protein n=1 Tax=Acinetobacter sp. WZC-1 TaxID=3459034 RepID=UPI00403E22E9